MTLEVLRALGLISIQDLGRPGRMHEGLAPGGALVPGSAIAANRALGNPDSAAVLEILGQATLRAAATTLIATESAVFSLAPSSAITISSHPRRVTYLAVPGGLSCPIVLGSRSTQLSAGLGSLLRAGAVLSPALPSPPSPLVPPSPASLHPLPLPAAAPIRLLAGPDTASFAPSALAVLTSAPYRLLPTSDRIGTRLSGPSLVPRPSPSPSPSRPLVRGALEVPTDGSPIVLGPEHPTTGGYAVLAVIITPDLDRFFSLPLGSAITFSLAPA